MPTPAQPPGDDCPKCGSPVIKYQSLDEGFARWRCKRCPAGGSAQPDEPTLTACLTEGSAEQ